MSCTRWWTGLAVALLAAGVYAKDYDIRLTRPMQVGQRYRVTINSTRQSKAAATINGQPQDPEEKSLSVSLTGVIEVLQISVKGTVLSEEYSIEKCTHTVGGETVELLKPGSVVTVRANLDGPIFEVDGQDLTDTQSKSLAELFSLNATPITDDDIFGTKTPRSPGDTWGVNVEQAQKLAKTAGVTLEDVAGEVTFVGTRKSGATDCLEISAAWSAGKIVPPPDTLPPKFTVTKATLKANTWGLYPQDGTSPAVHERVTEEMQRVLSGSNANKQKIVSATVGKRVREVKRSAIK